MNRKIYGIFIMALFITTVIIPALEIKTDENDSVHANVVLPSGEIKTDEVDSVLVNELNVPINSFDITNNDYNSDPYEIYVGQHWQLTITVYWDPPDPYRPISLWVDYGTLPTGATFPECVSGTGEVSGVLDWTPVAGQEGSYYITFYMGESCYEPLGYFTVQVNVISEHDCNPSIYVRNYVKDPDSGEWRDFSSAYEPLDVTIGSNVEFKILMYNDGEPLLGPLEVDYLMQDGLEFVSADPPPSSGMSWDNLGNIEPGETMEIIIQATAVGEDCHTYFTKVIVIAPCTCGEPECDCPPQIKEYYVYIHTVTGEPDCTIDLTIYDGLEGTGGGNVVPDPKEVIRGAFTVTNIQDTNADNIMDKNQNPVKATPKGRDEVDLMKMILHAPIGPLCGPESTVTLEKSGPNAGEVKLWDTKTKDNEIPPTNPPNQWKYKVKELPKTVWVEIREEDSTKLAMRGVTFTYSTDCCPEIDVVKATGIWSKVTDTKHDTADAWAGGIWPDMPANVRAYIDQSGGFGLRRYQDGGRWWYRDVIGIEFTVYPSGIGDEEGVYFDITRQIHYLDTQVPRAAGGPQQENWPNQVEEPNDDTHNGDESDKPVNNHMYSIDAVGFTEDGWGVIWWSHSKNNFMEFMRVRVDGIKPTGEAVLGSRCSPYYPWHAALWLSRDRANPGNVIRRFVGGGGAEIHPINCVEPGHILILDLNPPWNIP